MGNRQNIEPKPIADKQATIEIYKLLVEMADRVSARRQTANSFYLSINTAVLGITIVSFPNIELRDLGLVLVSSAGVLISIIWQQNIQSYKDLNSGKFHVITSIEKSLLPLAPFTSEWEYLGRDKKSSRRYKPFHKVEILVPRVFMFLHAVQILAIAFPYIQTWICDIRI